MEETLLTEEQLETTLKELSVEWASLPGQGLVRVFETGNFTASVALVVELANIAKKFNHDPDVHLTNDEVEVTLTTHSVGGVTQKDIAVARAIDQLNQN